MNKKTYNQDEAVKLLVAGDQRGLMQIYDFHAKTVFSKALSILRSAEHARDVVQEVFFTLWDERAVIRSATSFHDHLSQVVRQKIVQQLKAMFERERAEREFMGTAVALKEENVLYHMLKLEYRYFFDRFLAKVPDTQQKVFNLIAFEGLSYHAAADKLNLSLGSVKNEMSRVMKKMKEQAIFFLTIVSLPNLFE